MLFEGKLRVKAPIQKLWDVLLEPETLRECVPGAEKIERLDEKTYDCVIKQKVGPISVRFKFKNQLANLIPPTHMEMEGKGEDIGKAGHFSQKTTIDLKEMEDGEVEIFYQCNASVVGKLAMFGDRILRAKAKKVEAEFSGALKNKLVSLE
ncbi:MAG: carbon monoxide dehydrogenase subunit G [Candidatus Aminicenantes bacterium]|nr:carbon monoxide dehydrogenase subunit G [Candidatus Aminicenantes bacterium]